MAILDSNRAEYVMYAKFIKNRFTVVHAANVRHGRAHVQARNFSLKLQWSCYLLPKSQSMRGSTYSKRKYSRPKQSAFFFFCFIAAFKWQNARIDNFETSAPAFEAMRRMHRTGWAASPATNQGYRRIKRIHECDCTRLFVEKQTHNWEHQRSRRRIRGVCQQYSQRIQNTEKGSHKNWRERMAECARQTSTQTRSNYIPYDLLESRRRRGFSHLQMTRNTDAS